MSSTLSASLSTEEALLSGVSKGVPKAGRSIVEVSVEALTDGEGGDSECCKGVGH